MDRSILTAIDCKMTLIKQKLFIIIIIVQRTVRTT